MQFALEAFDISAVFLAITTQYVNSYCSRQHLIRQWSTLIHYIWIMKDQLKKKHGMQGCVYPVSHLYMYFRIPYLYLHFRNCFILKTIAA
jgi:hypothetical protein